MIRLPSPSAMMMKARRTVTSSKIATALRATKSMTMATAQRDMTTTMATDIDDNDDDNDDDDTSSTTSDEGKNCQGRQLLLR